MIIEQMTDSHRLLILVLATQSLVRIRMDPDMDYEIKECQDIIRMLSGTDTVVKVERAYPSGVASAS